MFTKPSAFEGDFHGEAAIWLTFGTFEATVLPKVGANLIAFRETEKGYHILREPAADEMEAFRGNPGVYGIPVLFPPNRYEDGKFPWKGKTYSLPINEPKRGNHLHGFLHTIPWEILQYGTNQEESFVTLIVNIGEGHPVYEHFPFTFSVKLRYSLSEAGLGQQIMIQNNGSESMPCLLAFHTAINAPFAPSSAASDYRVKLTIGNRFEMTERMLPTGQYQPLTTEEESLKTVGVNPYFDDLDNHYTAVPQNGRNYMELTDTRANETLIYDVGTGYKHWMIWNNEQTVGFFCPEPQINLVNAPNINKPAEEMGLISLEPGEIWEETSRLYLKRS